MKILMFNSPSKKPTRLSKDASKINTWKMQTGINPWHKSHVEITHTDEKKKKAWSAFLCVEAVSH